MKTHLQAAGRRTAAAIAVAGAAYTALATLTWCRYGHRKRRGNKDESPDLDAFIPDYEVIERHRILVSAPAEITFAVARGMNLQQSPVVRALFRTRELLFGPDSESRKAPPLGLLQQARQWGWGLLSEDPGREIVFGAISQPWQAHPVFTALPPAQFASFRGSGFAKIAWTVRVDPVDCATSMASTETRVATTDPVSRARFRCYWAFAMPGIVLVRLAALRIVKHAAETAVRESRPPAQSGAHLLPGARIA